MSARVPSGARPGRGAALAFGLALGAGLATVAPRLLDPVSVAAPLQAAPAQVAPAQPAPSLGALDYDPSVSLAPLVERLGPAVVHLKVSQKIDLGGIPRQMLPFLDLDPEALDQLRMGEGSGFVISADGYILTNNHVVADAEELTVVFADERELKGRVVGTDPRTDVALVKVDADGPLPTVPLGSSQAARVGDRVVAIGNPFGLSHTVTAGILSARGRVIGAGPYDDFLQTDASINPGNSGGPLFNLRGEVIGINTAINPRAQGIGFSVPIDMVTPLIDELKSTGRVARGWIGVGLKQLDAELAKQLELEGTEGVLVGAVYKGTPAADAGLLPGDVVLRLDGEAVGSSEALIRKVGSRRPGDVVKLDVVREGKPKTLKVALAERPDEGDLQRGRVSAPEPSPAPSGDDPLARAGLRVRPAAEVQGLKGAEGLVVVRVAANSPAAAELKAGDRLISVNGKPVSTEAALARAIGEADRALLVVERDGSQLLVELRIGR